MVIISYAEGNEYAKILTSGNYTTIIKIEWVFKKKYNINIVMHQNNWYMYILINE